MERKAGGNRTTARSTFSGGAALFGVQKYLGKVLIIQLART
jgi:hypothetical protein